MGTVLTVGNFDGVHVGHRALVAAARKRAVQGSGSEAEEGIKAPRHQGTEGETGPSLTLGAPEAGARVVALSFDPHPAVALDRKLEPARLSGFGRRAELLRESGADEVVRLEPTSELLSMSPEAFIERLVEEHSPFAIVEGEDFRFGKARAGTVDTLRELGERFGFDVEIVPSVEVELSDQTVVKASSSMTRWLLREGRVRDAARVLGRPYCLTGTVVRGDRRGRTIGYPTANLETPCMLPADGVYAGRARLDDGRSFDAAISVGTKPTFDGNERACEAFLLDASTNGGRVEGLDEYGWSMELDVVAWVRGQERFGTLDGLLEQMARDCERVRELLERTEEMAGCQ